MNGKSLEKRGSTESGSSFLMLSAAIFWADAAMDSEIRTAYLDYHKTLDSLPADEAADLLNAFTLTDETDYIKVMLLNSSILRWIP
ncbi:hypothetical protein [[Ruminococcus] lactaris]|uniref:hypothetical protein n=1 Tax=[Ruminococcus] lactaris TaxID=46228 RepID=UPI00242CDA3B|nr:hypothetical protein [[Ruminococcus] lactaris]